MGHEFGGRGGVGGRSGVRVQAMCGAIEAAGGDDEAGEVSSVPAGKRATEERVPIKRATRQRPPVPAPCCPPTATARQERRGWCARKPTMAVAAGRAHCVHSRWRRLVLGRSLERPYCTCVGPGRRRRRGGRLRVRRHISHQNAGGGFAQRRAEVMNVLSGRVVQGPQVARQAVQQHPLGAL